jgi:tRNA pseudouridine55 synthase
MLVGVEAGTKALATLIKLDKEYLADILIGESRTTGDMDGDVLESVDEVRVNESTVRNILTRLIGTHTLPVSAYSAIKRDGVPMYERAREAAKLGDFIKDVPFRAMTIHEAEFLGIRSEVVGDHERPICTVRFAVGSGTYIRSLAEELGRQLGYPAVLFGLRRTKVGTYRVEDARSLESF